MKNNIKRVHLYFDWNIFKYIEKPRNSNDETFSKFIKSIKDYILIAYSPFHISGLLKNFDDTKWEYIEKDCELIKSITNNLCLFYDNSQKLHLEYRDPMELFKEQLETTEMTKSLFNSDNLFDFIPDTQKKEFENDFNKINENNDLKKQGDPFSRIFLDSNDPMEAFSKLTAIMSNLNTDPNLYKQIREHTKNSLQQLKDTPEEELADFKDALKKNGINKSIDELTSEDLAKISSKFIEKKVNTDISDSYTQKDMFGITKPEKMTQKNTFKNIIDDSLHLEMAQYSLFYISEDNGNIEKAKIVSNEKKMGTHIYKIEEAIKYIGVNLYIVEKQKTSAAEKDDVIL